MRQKNLDLLLIMAAVIVSMLGIMVPFILHFMVIIIAIPIVFFIPGYLLCEVMFQWRMLSIYHRVAFSLSLSLAVVIVSGFGLNLLPIGLNTVSWTVFLGVFNTVFCCASFFLRHRAQAQRAQALKIHLAIHDYVFLALAILAIVFSFGYTANSISHQPGAGYTQLWMLPSQTNRNTWTINLGMQSEEAATRQYKLVVLVNGKPLKTWSSVSLAPNSTWKQQLPLTAAKTGKIDASAQLYLLDAPQVIYREVHVTLQKK